MKISLYKLLFFTSIFIAESSLFAAPQPVLDDTEAEQLRSLAFGVLGGNSLIVRSRQVDKVLSSGAGSSSKYGFAEEGGMIKEILWLRLHNAGSESWSTSSVEFTPNMDVSRYNSIVIWARAMESGQKFLVTVQDKGWKNKKEPQAVSPYFPLWGLPKGKILQVVIPFKALNYKASVDYARLSRLGFQFGRETAGNTDGDIIEILGISFIDQPEKQTRILFVDLDGKIQKHPSAPIQMAPKPTPFPRPRFAAQAMVKKSPVRREKNSSLNFAIDPTYFEPVGHGVIAYRDPTDDSQPVGELDEKKPYLGLSSQKMDTEVWFLVELDPHTSGWVPGSAVQFATNP